MSDAIKFTVTVKVEPSAVIGGIPVFVDPRVPRGELRFVQRGAAVAVIKELR